jgi:hypothetical protein
MERERHPCDGAVNWYRVCGVANSFVDVVDGDSDEI